MSEFSYLCTPWIIPYEYKTLTQVFNELATSFPDQEILIYRGLDGTRESLTCRQLQTQATKLAGYLIRKGIKKGNKIAISGSNTLEYAIAELAIIIAGGIVVHVPFNIANAIDVYKIISVADCRAFLIDPGKRDEYLETILRMYVYMEQDPDVLALVFLRESEHLTSYDDLPGVLLLEEETEVVFPTTYPEEEVAIFTVSKSTRKPKMIPKTHFHATNSYMIFSGKTYNDQPFFLVGGSPLFTVYQGEPRVFCDPSIASEGRNTMKIWEVIKEEQCTSALLLPSFLSDLVAHEEDYKGSFKLDVVSTCGQSADNIHTKVVGVFARTLTVGYGLTKEFWVSMLPPITSAGQIRAGDVGKPMPGIEVKIIDGDGNVLNKHQNGELCIRSMCGFEKYYKARELSDEVLLPGKWLRSGDIAHVNADNHIIIKGRVKDCITRGTRKIMPSSIDEVIITMNGVRDVIVVGVPDKHLYEEICVCYVTDPDHEISPTDVKEFCMREFVGLNAIESIGEMPYFLRFQSLPTFGNGQINKQQVRIDAIQQLELID